MKKEIVYANSAPSPIGPYSQAVIAGGMMYISGQIALDAQSGDLTTGDIREETRKVMENISSILEVKGLKTDSIVKASIFLTSMENFAAVNEVYSSFFTSDFPARETVEVSRLPKNVNVEISVIAVI